MFFLFSSTQDFSSCSVPCEFGHSANRKADATFGYGQEGSVPSILRSMESSHYYSENDPDIARRWVSTAFIFLFLHDIISLKPQFM
jgi:hypothetical protein